MVGLIDIAPVSETVEVNGVSLDVFGVSATAIADILFRFPEVRKAFAGLSKPADLIALGGDVVAAIIAAGCRSVDGSKTAKENAEDKIKAEARAASLPLEYQADILEVIIKLTMPSGVPAFLERLNAVMESAQEKPSVTEQAMKSLKASKA